MNTYYNEINSKPINVDDNGVLYKIPSGAMCGNGDLGVVFDNDDRGLVIHISKCDFWKFVSGAHNDGGIKTVGSLLINDIDLSSYKIKQYYDKGLLECKFGETEIDFFVAPENLIYFEIKVSESAQLPLVSVETPSTCNSLNSEYEKNGVRCFVRRFEGEELDRESAVAVCCRAIDSRQTDGCKCVRYCVSVVTNFDDGEYENKALDMVEKCDYDLDKQKTQEKWTAFFAASKVTLEDKVIESFYNSSLYLP